MAPSEVKRPDSPRSFGEIWLFSSNVKFAFLERKKKRVVSSERKEVVLNLLCYIWQPDLIIFPTGNFPEGKHEKERGNVNGCNDI